MNELDLLNNPYVKRHDVSKAGNSFERLGLGLNQLNCNKSSSSLLAGLESMNMQ